jgi:hypothetical protein
MARHTDDDHMQAHPQKMSSKGARHRARAHLQLVENSTSSDLEDEGFDGVLDASEPQFGRSMRSVNHRSRPHNHTKGRPELTATGREKVWKLPFWKRRSKDRRDRNVM